MKLIGIFEEFARTLCEILNLSPDGDNPLLAITARVQYLQMTRATSVHEAAEQFLHLCESRGVAAKIKLSPLKLRIDMGKSVLQDWVMEMGLRHQGVLLTAVRGCDTAPKNDASKDLQRCLRETFLVPFCTDSAKSVSFIEKVSDDELQRRMQEFTKSFDNYACHYVLHIVHAAEIIGWYHPNSLTASRWNTFYRTMCKKMHLNPEGKDQLDYRLGVDEETFGKLQDECGVPNDGHCDLEECN